MIKNEKISGFSEIELMCFLVIVGFFAVIYHRVQDYREEHAIQEDLVNISTYKTASAQFRTKYGQLPGDFNNAKNTLPDCADMAGGKVTCNGNGDGIWDNAEGFYVFTHLAKAGFLDDKFNVNADGSASLLYPTLGTTGQSIVPVGAFPKDTQEAISHVFFGYAPQNSFMIYFENNIPGGPVPTQKRVRHIVAETIDNKIDDGLAKSGDVRAAYDDAGIFGAYHIAELCIYSSGYYKVDEDNNLVCSLMIKY